MAAGRKYVLLGLLFAICALKCNLCSSESCAVFEFPEVKESAITAQESENVTLNFTLNKTNCVEDDFKDFNIEISKVGKDGNAGTYCSIRHRNGTCTNADRGCTCPGDDGSYQWSKTVDRKDNAKWVWHTTNKMTTKGEVFINVLYPAHVSDLTVNGTRKTEHWCEENTTQEIVCFWENGNPPVRARLLDSQGVELDGSNDSSGQIRYRFPAVDCRHTGPIRCEAPGATRNLTTTLIVKCLDVLENIPRNLTVMAGQSENLIVGVVSHAQLESMFCKLDSGEKTCGRFPVSVTGTPPNLTVAVWLNNVTKNDRGRWYLKMSNNAPTRSLFFNLEVIERARFVFSNVNDSVLSLEENTNLTLEFRLDKDHCPKKMFNKFTLRVAKFSDQNGIGAIVCNIPHLNGICRQPQGQACSWSQDSYSLNKIVRREDNGTWIWSASDEKAVTETITFNIKYNASITDLLLLNSSQLSADLIDVGTPAEIVCFWNNGNPPDNARLLDTQGTELNGTYSTGQIRYTFPAVSCQDAGLIRCEAPGASHNQTAVLLVKSPPEIKIKTPEIEFVPGEDVKIEINVCTHTNDLLSCQLTMLSDSEKSRTCTFGNDLSLTGTPPDLSLTITLDNVMKEEKGLWRLELTNDAGTDHADFHLATRADSSSVVTALPLVTTFAIVALAAVVTATVVLVARRCSSLQQAKTRRRPLPQRPDRVLFQQSDNASMDPDNLNLYQEIDNDSRQRPADVPGQPNDYLELIGLPSEVEENQSEGPTHRIQTDEDGYLRPSARD